MTDGKAAKRSLTPPLTTMAFLRDLVARYSTFFMLIWLGGLIALAPLSLLPGTAPPTGIGNVELSLDKFFHVIAYGGLTGIPMLALARRDWLLIAVAIVMIAAFGYEIGQGYVPGRSFGYDDLLANIGGVVLGMALGAWIQRLPRKD